MTSFKNRTSYNKNTLNVLFNNYGKMSFFHDRTFIFKAFIQISFAKVSINFYSRTKTLRHKGWGIQHEITVS